MRLLKNGDFFEDTWIALGDDDDIVDGADIVVSFDRLMRDFATLKAHDGRLAVDFPNDCAIEDLADYASTLDKVILHFPKFTDGRAYSQARILRTELGFAGEIQSSGNVLPDQIAFMRQCGIDVFHVNGRFDLDHWQRAATSMSLTYQNGYAPAQGFSPANVWQRREARNDDPLRSDFEEVWTA